MKPPPFMLFAALLFWGWQTDFLFIGGALGVVLELPRFVKFRWELDDTDFNRISSFCIVLNIALMGYVFTNNDVGGANAMLHGNTVAAAAKSGALTTTRFLRWLPMTLFAFVAAQAFNTRPSVPLTAISPVLRWRRRRGDKEFAGYYYNILFPYFIVCLFAAGIHENNGSFKYFIGLCLLTLWALRTVRPPRFKLFAWFAAIALCGVFGVFGIFGIHKVQASIQNFNAAWMIRLFGNRVDPLQTMTSMGRIGQMKLSAKIVIRLEPHTVGHAPAYLREASYKNYHPQKMTWYAGGGLSDFEVLQSEADGTTWNLTTPKTNTDSINIACYLEGYSRELEAPEGLLPLPSGCSRLENTPPDMILKKNKNGALLAAGRGLMIFDAHYGGGATLDSPPDVGSTNRFDLTVPTNEIPALDQVIAEINLPPNASDLKKRQAVERFFLNHFTYSMWQGDDKRADTNGTPLTKFLTTSRSGHCEFFASATVLLLRELGIPARYAVGYYVHETRGTGYVVRERDGHAWCLVWNRDKNCWEDFDTTPGSWVAIEGRRTEMFQWLSDVRSWLGFEFAKFRWRQAQLQQYILWALVPVLLVLLWHIIFRRRGKLAAAAEKKSAAEKVLWPGLDSEFYALEKKLADRGLPRQAGEPLADWLERALADRALTSLRSPLQELLRLHYRHRFDPHGLPAAERERLRDEAKACLDWLLRPKP
jgi:protein-glutamine gamma-glutamyltransferase